MTENIISPFRNGVFNNASNWPESCLIFFILKMAIQNANKPDAVTQIPGAAQFKYLISNEIIFDNGIDKNKCRSMGNMVKIPNKEMPFFLIFNQSRYNRTPIITQGPHPLSPQINHVIGKYCYQYLLIHILGLTLKL